MKLIGNVKVEANKMTVTCHDFIRLPDGKYELTVEHISKARTLRQNRYLWALIGEIARELQQTKNDVYLQLLRTANVRSIELGIDSKALVDFVKASNLKGYRVLSSYVQNGRKMIWCEFYIGTSQMNTKEMNAVIDNALDWAEELDIETDAYTQILKEGLR